MSTLYLDRKGIQLKIIDKTITCYINDIRQRPFPLKLLERVVISCSVELSSQTLLRLASEGIAVTIINPRNANQQGMLLGPSVKNPFPRIWQYHATTNKQFCEQIAQSLVTAKIRNQLRLLNNQLSTRTEHRYAIIKSIGQLNESLTSLQNPVNLSTLRGIEGYAAKVSFGVYQLILPSSLGFTGRKRRPPPDPVNASLSLAYTLLHSRATQQAYAQGLDPMLGFLHEAAYSRDSLAADLIEPRRPYIDEWVLEKFNQQFLRANDFKADQNAYLLSKLGRAKYYASLEPLLKRLTRGLRLQIRQLKRQLETEYNRVHELP